MADRDIRAAIETAEPISAAAQEIVDAVNEQYNGDPPEPPEPPEPGGDDGGEGDGGRDILAECAALDQNDTGNGQRFILRHGDDLIYAPGGGWYVWDGTRFVFDGMGSAQSPALNVRRRAQATAKLIEREAWLQGPTEGEQKIISAGKAAEDRLASAPAERSDTASAADMERRRQWKADIELGAAFELKVEKRVRDRRRFALSCGNSSKVSNMVEESRPHVALPISDFDKNDYLINCASGSIVFERAEGLWTYRVKAHDRTDRCTRICPVEHDEAATCPTFEAFVEQVLPDDEVRAYVKRFLGYSALGITIEQAFCFLYGDGQNGKSTLVDAVCNVLGDYADIVPFETLAGEDHGRGGEATPELAKLFGRRLVRTTEPEQKMVLREGTIKKLTSSEPVPVRKLFGDFVDLVPNFKILISGNHKPRIEGTDLGIWRRVMLVPFTVTIAEADRDKRLPEKLGLEAAGIFNWILAGALEYLEQGLNPPAAVREAVDEYREENDPISAFIKAALEVTNNEADIERPGDLVKAYQLFAGREGHFEYKGPAFMRKFPKPAELAGIVRKKTSGRKVYCGVRIKDEYKDHVPADDWHGNDG